MDNYRIGNRCDVGKVRASNQDNMVTFECALGRVVVVCDGMGGRNGGEVASQIATEVIKDILQNNTFADPNEAITKSMVAANQAILHKGSVEPDLNGMGTTCVMAIIKDGMVYYGAVGDSRIYYITKSGILQLTKDQSYVQMLVDMGEIKDHGYSVGASANHAVDENGKILRYGDPRVAKARSKTFPGIAKAMAEQWG